MRFGQVCDELVARAPLHRMGHAQALQYWCKKWSGLHELMRDFATRAAAASPSLAALPLRAAHKLGDDERHPFRSPTALAALDVLLPWLAGVGADTRWLRNDRGWAILALTANERYAEDRPLPRSGPPRRWPAVGDVPQACRNLPPDPDRDMQRDHAVIPRRDRGR
ncbi:hypothetical protein [Saccharothrix luteola]|uniref:hypothetical protein n=1 Tax=Saccharothrix luteola TaxID=2893018 RepID=UPI001E5FA184|nr:hypothetical protein [Saccharothrix luteola]MCC8251557.1 hypothetical protein [Saccharothrix luteola]